MMGADIEKQRDAETLALKGALTIDRVRDLKNILIGVLNRKDHVVLNLDGVTEVDLSCLQLLCSAHRTSLELHKQLTLVAGKSGAFQQTVKDAGFTRPTGCHKDTNKSCLWIGGLE